MSGGRLLEPVAGRGWPGRGVEDGDASTVDDEPVVLGPVAAAVGCDVRGVAVGAGRGRGVEGGGAAAGVELRGGGGRSGVDVEVLARRSTTPAMKARRMATAGWVERGQSGPETDVAGR